MNNTTIPTIDTTAQITASATVGDLIDVIQEVMDSDRWCVVLVDTDGRFHAAPSYSTGPRSHWTETYGPVVEVIDVEEQQCLGYGPETAEELAAMAIRLGRVDYALSRLN